MPVVTGYKLAFTRVLAVIVQRILVNEETMLVITLCACRDRKYTIKLSNHNQVVSVVSMRNGAFMSML